MKKAQEKDLIRIINDLNGWGFRNVAIERILKLPFGTINRWKSTRRCSSASLALMRMVYAMPWLLKVADDNFDLKKAAGTLVMAAGELIGNDPEIKVEKKK